MVMEAYLLLPNKKNQVELPKETKLAIIFFSKKSPADTSSEACMYASMNETSDVSFMISLSLMLQITLTL